MPGRNRIQETDKDILKEIHELAIKPAEKQRLFAPKMREHLINKWPKRQEDIGAVDRIRRLIQDLRELAGTPEQQALESPFHWEYTDTYNPYGIPWDASEFLLNMYRFCTGAGLLPHPWIPTVRFMRWCWRIHLAAPGLKSGQAIWHLAQSYTQREQRRDLLGKPSGMEGLSDFLAFTPWLSKEHENMYYTALSAGGIVPLEEDAQADFEGLPIVLLASATGTKAPLARLLINSLRVSEGIEITVDGA